MGQNNGNETKNLTVYINFSSGVASDRLAIETDGGVTYMLSSQHLLSCIHGNDGDGCDGGHVDKAWYFLRHNGILIDQCYLYSSGDTKTAGQCFVNKTVYPPSTYFCDAFKLYIHTTPAYRISRQDFSDFQGSWNKEYTGEDFYKFLNEIDIMIEIIRNGPVQALMRITQDFFMYKSGVYRCSNIQPNGMEREGSIGYHSVRIIGWGQETSENGEILKYWVCINSWGQQWGENGYFRIERRNVHCNIESFVIATHISTFEIAENEEDEYRCDGNSTMGKEACGPKRDSVEIYQRNKKRLIKKVTTRVVVKRRRKIIKSGKKPKVM